jgi:hypothetical protein
VVYISTLNHESQKDNSVIEQAAERSYSFMRNFLFALIVFSVPVAGFAQRAVQMKTLWDRPQVHVLFQGYTLSFSIKDINKALQLLSETGDIAYGAASKLDTAKDYYIELYPGLDMQYRNSLQPLIQRGVGAFLLTAGHALIETRKHKLCREIIEDIKDRPGGDKSVVITFTDPKTKTGKMIFFGTMSVAMYGKDLGIDME